MYTTFYKELVNSGLYDAYKMCQFEMLMEGDQNAEDEDVYSFILGEIGLEW